MCVCVCVCVCVSFYIYNKNYAAFKGNIYFAAIPIDIGEREMQNFVSLIKQQVELRRNKQFE
jgi:hypothetical protein